MNKKMYCVPIIDMELCTVEDVLTASMEDTNSFVKDSYDWLGEEV